MTNPIGTGTRNVSLNAPIDWWTEIGRAASRANVSVGEFIRRKVERAAEADHPELALRLREVRRQYYGAALGFIFIAGLIASWFAHDGQDMARRARARGRGPGTVRVGTRALEEEVEV